jgi:hypothetical protein
MKPDRFLDSENQSMKSRFIMFKRSSVYYSEDKPCQNNGNYGGGVFSSGRKRPLEPKKASRHPLCRRKKDGGPENRLANL